MEGRHLEGKRIAITGPRKTEEMGRMVEKRGGVPLARPAQGTVFLDDEEVRTELRWVIEEELDWFIFTSGMGLETILERTRQLGINDPFMEKLRHARIAARGYKAIGGLKKLGLQPLVRDPDGTTAGLVKAFAPYSLRGMKVALQLHGDPAPALVEMLEREGADYKEILPYRHIPPAEEDLERLVREILAGEVDAVMFTSGAQVRFPFEYAKRAGIVKELQQAFGNRTVAAAIGKFTAECLREEGIERIVVPQEERMIHMVNALSDYYAGINQ